MADELVSGLLKEINLRVVLVTATELARRARELHRSSSGSAVLMAQGLSAGALMGSLQKSDARVNLQLECDGPLRGLFVDADSSGILRGYVKNPLVSHLGNEGAYHWRPALGNKGFLSVLRDLGGGEYYRSAVELESFDLARDLERYFSISDQLPTRVYLTVLPEPGREGEEPLGRVVGMFLQPLPDGDMQAFREWGDQLAQDFEERVRTHAAQGATALLKALVPREDLELLSRYPISFNCGCSKERVKRALMTLGREELEDILQKEGKAEADCHFCTTHYVVTGAEIRELLSTLAQALS